MPTVALIGGAAIAGGAATAWSNKKASEASERESRKARAVTEVGIKQGREDVNRLFNRAAMSADTGFRGAEEVFRQMMPMQSQTFQGGNVAAQQAILAGLPQIQNALMGNAVDYSGFKPYTAALQGFDYSKIPRQPNQFFRATPVEYNIPSAPSLDLSSPQNSGYFQGGKPVASPWSYDQQMSNLQNLMSTGVF